MQNATSITKPGLKREIVYRIQIAIFWGLCMLLSNTVLHPVTNGVIYFTLGALFELFTIQAMQGLFGDTPLVQDANELNFYGVLIHIAAIPFYLGGVSSSYHNNAINGLIVFYLVRLFYFGERRADGEFTGWAKFGALNWARYFISRMASTDEAKTMLSVAKGIMAIATIVPLWAITIKTNDDKTSLFTVLATSFILIYGYWKSTIANSKATQAEELLNDEAIALLKAYNARTSDARRMIQRIAVEEFTALEKVVQSVEAVNAFDINDQPGYALSELGQAKRDQTFILWVAAVVVVTLGISLYTEKKAMFEFGYASGYSAGKAGEKPTSEPSWDRVSECHNRDARQGPRPDSCYDKPPKK